MSFFVMSVNAAIIPVGIQTDVAESTVIDWGWTECSRTSANESASLSGVLSACDGDFLMMAAWDASKNAFGILGAGLTNIVSAITYTDSNSDNGGTTLNNWSNGINFYRTANFGSWGFTSNSLTELNSADILLLDGLQSQSGQVESELSRGLSWHINGDIFGAGWAYNGTGNNFTGIYDSGDQRVFYTLSRQIESVPTPATFTIFMLGLITLPFLRKKQ